MYFKKLLILFIVILCAGCGSVEIESFASATPSFVTATLPATSAPQPTQTLLPPSPIPTNQPIEAATTTQLNVRTETNTASASLGVIVAFSNIQVIGQESSGNWLKIIYLESVGWVRSEFVQVDSSVEIPVIEIDSGNGSARSALVISGINVRNGAGTQYESIGVLTQKDVVLVTGKDSSGAWMQIIFQGDTGWVASEFLQIENVEEISIIENSQSTEISPVSETTIAPAQVAIQDSDSIQSPLLRTFFTESKILQITGEVSAPPGDYEDWLEFSSFTTKIVMEATCSSTGLQVELWRAGEVVESFSSICESTYFLNIFANESYTLRIFTGASNYIKYQLSMKVNR